SLAEDVDALIWHLQSPIMAIGVPTFWAISRAAKALGIDALVSGIGGDHPFIGRARWPSDLPPSPRELFVACTNVHPDTLLSFATPGGPVARALARVEADFAAALPADRPAPERIERFFARHFLQEHMRMAEE